MGRYRSEQYFPDTATAKVKIDGLTDAAAGHYGPGAGAGARSGGQGAAGAAEAAKTLGNKAPPAPEKIERQVGSTAGASSSEFHIYRASRRREITRIEMQEKEKAAAEEAAEYSAKVAANQREALDRTRRNAEKRRKRKGSGKVQASVAKVARTADSSGSSSISAAAVAAYLSSDSDSEDADGGAVYGEDEAGYAVRRLLAQSDA